jgi:TolB-like protein
MNNAENVRIGRTRRTFLLCVLLVFSPLSVWTQETITRPPRVGVFPPVNESGRDQYTTLSQTMGDTIAFTLRLLGDFDVQRTVERDVGTVAANDSSAMGELAASANLDYIIFGELDEDDDGSIRFEMVVWDSDEEAITIRREAVAESLFDTFDVADELTLELLSALSGRRIAFGAVQLDLPTSLDAYGVFVDDQFAGFGSSRLERIPAGERRIRIVSFTGDPSGSESQAAVVLIEPDATATVSFDIAPPTVAWLTPEFVRYTGTDDAAGVERESPDGVAGGTVDPDVDADSDGAVRDGGSVAAFTDEPEVPDWFEGGFDEGNNPAAAFLETSFIRDVVGDEWFHEPDHWLSEAGRFPLVKWRIDGTLDEWPWTIPYYPIDPRSDPGAPVRISQVEIAYGAASVILSMRFAGEWEAFFRNAEPHVFVETTMYGSGPPTRRNFNINRKGGRWRGETRLNRNPYEEYPFEGIPGFRGAVNERRLEVQIPFDVLGGDRLMEITDIGLETLEGDGLVKVYSSGPPLDPRHERRR